MKKKNEEMTESTILQHKDHKAPMTRRDFLATGAISMSTMAFTSGATALLTQSNPLGAAVCDQGNVLCGDVPFLCIDGAGGMGIAGSSVIVGFDKGTEFQESFAGNASSDFRRLGIPDTHHPSKPGMIDNTFGIKFHSTSGILEGMNEVLAPRMGENRDLREFVDGVLLTCITNDDTNQNPINTVYMAQKAGARGNLVQLIGNRNSVSGGSSIAPNEQVNLTLKPSQLNRFNDSSSLLSIGSSIMGTSLLNGLDPNGGSDRMRKFMDLIRRSGTGKLGELGSNAMLARDVERYADRQVRVNEVFDRFSPSELNPLTNSADGTLIARAYGRPAIANLSANEQMSANILNLLTKKIAGAGTIAVGGCDYHDGTATRGHAKDKEIGIHIGHAIRMAAERNKPIFIHLFTDGGVTGDAAGQVDPNLETRVVWRSDDGVRGAMLMIGFHPTRRRVSSGQMNENSNFIISGKTRQIGYYRTAGGTATDGHSLANNVSRIWVAVILNYLATMVNSNDDQQIIREVEAAFKDRFRETTLPPDWQNLIRFRSLIA
jgi:hypothetical protein